MITATFNCLDGIYSSFKIQGHANFAEYGKDIVCSSVTTATFYTIGLLQRLFTKYANYIEEDGLIECVITTDMVDQDLLKQIIENYLDVLDNIQKQYPKNLKIIIAKK